jgi:hypothetical protein
MEIECWVSVYSDYFYKCLRLSKIKNGLKKREKGSYDYFLRQDLFCRNEKVVLH